MRLWVDTDYGFDDLWALLVLRHGGVEVAGISLVAGNAPLPQVIANAQGAARHYGFTAPLHTGADRPLKRAPETAERILGPRGMQSRGAHLPQVDLPPPPFDAVAALVAWLMAGGDHVLALGPLTNIARLVQDHPEAAARIQRLVWMGGSDGPGNHSAAAEFNALADPEAADIVARAGLPLEVVDLMACRKVTFTPDDLPPSPPLTADLLGGYLDIGLSRGRPGMAIYDPLAALAITRPEALRFEPRAMAVSLAQDDSYGATTFTAGGAGRTRLATGVDDNAARLCLAALKTVD
ncbi:Inosine-uridine nucleoside N-ribohydrolase [Pseudooceanicola antarcticus]|uniref:Inosine-uridine nucleoside N-ribohydrolase n=1 Tax=Pseudooceanicola antarcticus TaxID=1247613 RepID=A0A285HZ76_9RHOB|nr:nucleoside hydrolase [Pseudooceanicola antarcticus]PJE30329.1 nucleoside hydrolase [Pseudooceanicola antarcticus]SNY41022.1 Inosine-uridine nucleoside N-ribohydrolase [Pseudooceanicola antarcticus]